MRNQRYEYLRINGGVPLYGTVRASGSKNAALPIMAASLLADGPVRLCRVPDLADVDTLASLLRHLGMLVDYSDLQRCGDRTLRLETVCDAETRAPLRFVRRMRASFCLLGPLLARRRAATVALPGGCHLGSRPVDLHLRGLEALGAQLRLRKGYVVARAPNLHGAEIDLSGPMGPTVTGTANIMSAAVLARGRTVIRGAACEPEIVDLGDFLNALGAAIDGLGTSTIEIQGVDHLGQRQSYEVIPDRVEAATMLLAIAAAGGRATIGGVAAEHLTAVLSLLNEIGASCEVDGDRISIESASPLRPFDVVAMPYPGIPTDVQPLLAPAAAGANGRSRICDNVFPDRWLHIGELQRLGVAGRVVGNAAIIDGQADALTGACVTARDLRGAAALVLAGVAARGTTSLRGIHHLDRGYARLEQKLSALGADIERRMMGCGRESILGNRLVIGRSG